MNIRSLHLRGATGPVRTEMWEGREHLVVPVVALQEAVIHAVNAETTEYVPQAPLLASVGKWNGHPLVVGHPVKNGQQISAHTPEGRAAHFGFIRASSMTGARLGMEGMVDVARLEKLGERQFLADLRAGKPIEVSVGAFVNANDKRGTFGGKAYVGEWTEITPDHLAFLPRGVGACSMAMGCGAHRAAMLVTAEGFEDIEEKKMKKPTGMAALKAKMLALFDTGEADAAEEAAELVAYNAMKVQATNATSSLDEAASLIDELIADEEDDPTETRQQEAAEETVESARLDAIRMHCYSAISALQAVCNACMEQQMPDVTPSDPRYMEAAKAAYGKEPKDLTILENAAVLRALSDLRVLVGKEISAKNKKVIQSAHDASHDMHTHTVALGADCAGMKTAAAKDCPNCDGTGQVKDGDKQKDCEACGGEGIMKTAEMRAACSCGEPSEAEMKTKAERIAALTAAGVKDITDKTSDDVLTVLEAGVESAKQHAVALKTAQDKQAETELKLKAAEAKQIPDEELVSLRALSAEKQQKDAAEKADLVTRLEALKTLSKEQLEAKPLDELRTLAKFAKLEVKKDYSIIGLPVHRAAAAANNDFTAYAPPNSFEAPLKALQESGKR